MAGVEGERADDDRIERVGEKVGEGRAGDKGMGVHTMSVWNKCFICKRQFWEVGENLTPGPFPTREGVPL